MAFILEYSPKVSTWLHWNGSSPPFKRGGAKLILGDASLTRLTERDQPVLSVRLFGKQY